MRTITDICFECKAPTGPGHRFCDCRPDPLCSECFEPHTDECPRYGDYDDPRDYDRSDLGVEDGE
jgi:hypothetical protein